MNRLSKFLVLFFSIFQCCFSMAQGQQIKDINSKVVVIEINDYSFVNLDQIKYLENSIIKINRANPKALVVKINCSGGLASELREFIGLYKNLNISWKRY